MRVYRIAGTKSDWRSCLLAGWPAVRSGARPAQPAPPQGAASQALPEGMPRVVLTAGRSMVLPTEFNITRIALTNPAVADAVVVAPREILIDGKTAGTISLIVWGASQRAQYDLVVRTRRPDDSAAAPGAVPR